MAELATLADIQCTVYPKEVTHKLHVMAQAKESLPVIDRRSNHCAILPLTVMSDMYLYFDVLMIEQRHKEWHHP